MFAFILLAAMVLSMIAVPAVAEHGETETLYTGQGFTNGELDEVKCDPFDTGQYPSDGLDDSTGYLHWILTATDATYAQLHGPWGTIDMVQPPSDQGAWHGATVYYPVEELTTFPVTATHDGHGTIQLTVSNGCPGDDPFVPEGALAIEKTAEGTFTRTYLWDVDKDGETETQELFGPGDSVDLDYTVLVSLQDPAHSDSNHHVTGTIEVANTGNAPAELDGVFDSIDGATIVCFEDDPITEASVAIGFPYTLDMGASILCTYEVATDADENTATVSGTFLYSEVDAGTPDEAFDEGEFEGDADIEYTETETIDACVEVDDTLEGFLGYVCVDDASAEALAEALESGEDVFVVDGDGEYEFMYTYTAVFGADVCGVLDNTATVYNLLDDPDVLADDSHSVNIDCFEFDGETAWAANGEEPGELRYRNRGNWATYVEYNGEKTTTLFAGQHIDVGTVHFSGVVDGEVTITVNLTGGWEYEADIDNLMVQDYMNAPSGNPAPGQFDHKEECDADELSCSIVVPANNYYGVHVNVGKWVEAKF